jgi:hypothetical protein
MVCKVEYQSGQIRTIPIRRSPAGRLPVRSSYRYPYTNSYRKFLKQCSMGGSKRTVGRRVRGRSRNRIDKLPPGSIFNPRYANHAETTTCTRLERLQPSTKQIGHLSIPPDFPKYAVALQTGLPRSSENRLFPPPPSQNRICSLITDTLSVILLRKSACLLRTWPSSSVRDGRAPGG